ncbi:unnamed protein product [Schistosoma mattheei]|uniref:Uncharacterized protein n=1 Tax=Schistosoma mattheei TaxID=31246 RepID=A0A183NLX4_9TREM|nr:unnamed protein product [Schistosoma mattheei]
MDSTNVDMMVISFRLKTVRDQVITLLKRPIPMALEQGKLTRRCMYDRL